jgi:hypothetical protein
MVISLLMVIPPKPNLIQNRHACINLLFFCAWFSGPYDWTVYVNMQLNSNRSKYTGEC